MTRCMAAVVATITTLCSSSAFALDASELASLRDAVREMCVAPDRIGDYLKTEGTAKIGAPVIVKIINADLSGTLSYEKWNGISIATDKYKTDPRQCAIELMRILQPAVSYSGSDRGSVTQSSSGAKSPNINTNQGTINIK